MPKKKLNILKKLFKKNVKYKPLKNYDPDGGLPPPWESYQKYDQPEPPDSVQKGTGRKYKKKKAIKRVLKIVSKIKRRNIKKNVKKSVKKIYKSKNVRKNIK